MSGPYFSKLRQVNIRPAIVLVAVAALLLLFVAPPAAFAYENEELEFLSLINSHRQANGLAPLTMSVSLYNASEGHSWDMGARGFFGHNTPEGVTPWDRMRAAGYGYNTYLGENIAAGFNTAQSVFEAWRNSPSHNVNMLNGNFRAIGIGRSYVPGSIYGYYWTTDFGGVTEDSSPPSVAITSPSGSSASGTINFTASAADNVSVTKVDLYIDNTLYASDSSYPYSYTWNTTVSPGNHVLKAVAFDTAGLWAQTSKSVTVSQFNATSKYYFTWYDQSTPDWKNWVMMVNPSTGQATARAAALVGDITQFDKEIAVGAPADAPQFPGLMGGPVIVGATEPLITSQRVVYKNSFNEIPGMPVGDLESTYFFTWYDSSPGNGMVGDWILIGNQGNATANVEVYIGGQLKGSYSVPVGGRVVPSYPDTTDGPVKVTATNGQPLIVSQRVVYKNSFNEVLGVPASRIGSDYDFTWYDNKPENNMRGNWIVIGNQDTGTAEVDVYIGGERMGTYTIPQGDRITPDYSGVMDGPVRVVSTNGKKLIVSQRMLFKDSFEEFQGLTARDTGTDLWFTWYDSKWSNGMNGNWLMIANKGNSQANVDIYVGGTRMQQLALPVGVNTPVQFTNTMGGPVRVVSTNGQPIMATQRVLYLSSFNEIGGMQLR